MNDAALKYLDANKTGVVPAHIFNGNSKEDYDRPTWIAVKNGKVWFSGTKAQCKRMIGR